MFHPLRKKAAAESPAEKTKNDLHDEDADADVSMPAMARSDVASVREVLRPMSTALSPMTVTTKVLKVADSTSLRMCMPDSRSVCGFLVDDS